MLSSCQSPQPGSTLLIGWLTRMGDAGTQDIHQEGRAEGWMKSDVVTLEVGLIKYPAKVAACVKVINQGKR